MRIWEYSFKSGAGGGVHLVIYPVTMYSFKSEIQRQPTMFKHAKFCACNQLRLRSAWASAQSAVWPESLLLIDRSLGH